MLNKMNLWKKENNSSSLRDRVLQIKEHDVPSHVAIIMDGNGRWAKKRALPRVAGHHEGMKVVRSEDSYRLCFFNRKLETAKNGS